MSLQQILRIKIESYLSRPHRFNINAQKLVQHIKIIFVKWVFYNNEHILTEGQRVAAATSSTPQTKFTESSSGSQVGWSVIELPDPTDCMQMPINICQLDVGRISCILFLFRPCCLSVFRPLLSGQIPLFCLPVQPFMCLSVSTCLLVYRYYNLEGNCPAVYQLFSHFFLSRLLVSLYLLGCSCLSISTCLTVSLFVNL